MINSFTDFLSLDVLQYLLGSLGSTASFPCFVKSSCLQRHTPFKRLGAHTLQHSAYTHVHVKLRPAHTREIYQIIKMNESVYTLVCIGYVR